MILSLVLLVGAFVFPSVCTAQFAMQDFGRVTRSCRPISGLPAAQEMLIPLGVLDRRKLDHSMITGRWRDYRSSYGTSHLHAGIDLEPPYSKGRGFPVLAAAEGVVCATAFGRPEQTVVVQHQHKEGRPLFSLYKHLARIYVRPGDVVGKHTILGLTESRYDRHGPTYAHLHFEIRRTLADGGKASYMATNRHFAKIFANPEEVLKSLERF